MVVPAWFSIELCVIPRKEGVNSRSALVTLLDGSCMAKGEQKQETPSHGSSGACRPGSSQGQPSQGSPADSDVWAVLVPRSPGVTMKSRHTSGHNAVTQSIRIEQARLGINRYSKCPVQE